MGREPSEYIQVYSSPEMWLYWLDLLPVQSGSADCIRRRIVFKYSLSYSIVLFYSMLRTLHLPAKSSHCTLTNCFEPTCAHAVGSTVPVGEYYEMWELN